MKAFAFLPAAAAAVLAFNISVASSQDVCVNEYTACMNSCGLKPSKSMQDGCFAGCETKNGMCSERVFGKRPSNATVATPAPAAAQAKDAMAQKELPQAREEQAAPEPEQAASEAAPESKKAPQQRIPVRR